MITGVENQEIWEAIHDLDVAMLTTIKNDKLHARPMLLTQDSYEGVLWFVSHESTAKCLEIVEEHQVCVTFSDERRGLYISLSGEARLNQNTAIIQSLWRPKLGLWLGCEQEDKALTVVEIDVFAGEYWHRKGGRLTNMYQIFKSQFTNEEIELAEHKTFGAV